MLNAKFCSQRRIRTKSNIYDGFFFSKIGNGYEPSTIFAKMLACRYLTGF